MDCWIGYTQVVLFSSVISRTHVYHEGKPTPRAPCSGIIMNGLMLPLRRTGTLNLTTCALTFFSSLVTLSLLRLQLRSVALTELAGTGHRRRGRSSLRRRDESWRQRHLRQLRGGVSACAGLGWLWCRDLRLLLL